ncbi:DegT/DnrJ/EryC1/StrS family aminotransferase [Geotalea toluenoxydans]|uniref:DegT/DnrJ/EryC1/StrS family aminotransferase n=1 Tax=Geotalea toluenoxydans TaxID=421624 RepID=UPI0006D17C42|nr:DegT/DnrJ/EryC1/StrS family aminotransferase [Geotalea toluenoxydans]
MRIGRSIPPAAAPISLVDLLNGIRGLFNGQREIERFENELKEYFGVKHCFLVSSGKAALTVILEALKELSPGREEVVIPAYTCYSVPAAVIRAGLKIRLCDIDAGNLGFDCSKLASLLEKRRTLCLVPTYLYGLPCQMERIKGMARDWGTLVVEDAAQAMGSEVDGIKLGCVGDVSFFSLGRGKALSTVEGGIIITDRDDIARPLHRQVEKLPPYSLARNMMLIVHALALFLFLRPSLFWLPKSIPSLGLGKTVFDPGFDLYGMSPFQAGLAGKWGMKISRFRMARRQLVNRWQALTNAHRFFRGLTGQDSSADLIRFPVSIADESFKEKVLNESERSGLGIMGGYPASVNRIEEIAHLFHGETYPAAEKAARELVTFPVHPLITSRDAVTIEKFVKEW